MNIIQPTMIGILKISLSLQRFSRQYKLNKGNGMRSLKPYFSYRILLRKVTTFLSADCCQNLHNGEC